MLGAAQARHTVAPDLQCRFALASTVHALPTRLWLVRHGESAGNLALLKADSAGSATIEIEGRDVDVPLSELGARQSRAVGRWFRDQPPNERPSVIISSPYVRALQTTENIARELSAANMECLVDERLREKEFGELIGSRKPALLCISRRRRVVVPIWANFIIGRPAANAGAM